MKRIFKFEFFLPILLSLLLLGIAMSPLYFQYKITPPGNVFLGLHNNILDFPMFISAIRQGQMGHLTQIQSLTSEPQMGTFVHFIYLPAGWITGIFKIHPVVVYHALRILIGFCLLLSFYAFIRLFTKNKWERLMVFFLGIFAGGFPRLVQNNGNWMISNIPFLSFYTGFDVLKRSVFLPHALLKDTLFLCVIINWILLWEKGRKKYFWRAVISGFFLGFLSPIHSLFLYGTMWLIIPIKVILKTADFPIRRYVKMVSYYTFVTISSSIYLYWVFSIPPWNAVKIWESDKYYGINFIEYIMAAGPMFFLAIPALLVLILKFLSKKGGNFSTRYYFLCIIPLITTPFLFINIQKLTGLTDLRFLGIPLQFFWAILGGLTIIEFTKWIRNGVKNKNISKNFILIICSLIVFLPTLPTIMLSWKSQQKEFDPHYFNIYPPKEYYAGLLWLSNNTKPEEIVFSDFSFGSLAPSYAGNTVYFGHPVSTVNFLEKKQDVATFYKTTMSEKEAKDFLKIRNIKYVVWSFDEWNYGGDAQKYKSILKLRFNNSMMYIFEVL